MLFNKLTSWMELQWPSWTNEIQGDTSCCSLGSSDIKSKVVFKKKEHILKLSFYFHANRAKWSTWCVTLYWQSCRWSGVERRDGKFLPSHSHRIMERHMEHGWAWLLLLPLSLKVARWQNLISPFLGLRQGGGGEGRKLGKEGIKFCSAA